MFGLYVSLILLFRIGVSVKQQFTEEEIYKDRDSQISAIEKTFEDAQKTVSQHIFRLHVIKHSLYFKMLRQLHRNSLVLFTGTFQKFQEVLHMFKIKLF